MAGVSALDRDCAVLGIHAAHAASQPSAVALWRLDNHRWRCLRVAPSCASFCGTVDWSANVASGRPGATDLLEACRRLLNGMLPAVVATSTPLARKPITGRRLCDSLVCQALPLEFGLRRRFLPRQALAGLRLYRDLRAVGFALITSQAGVRRTASLVEVDPRLAVMAVSGRRAPVRYKASRARAYWPGLSRAARFHLLLQEWRSILWRLGKHASAIELPLPRSPEHWSFSRLQRFEDGINALACAWSATEFLAGRARRLGDETAAIWVPQAVLAAR